MDGNGRWAQQRSMPRAEGYAYGLVALYKVAKRCSERGVEAVSVYAFSTENNGRPEEEIEAIAKVVQKFNLTYDGDYKLLYGRYLVASRRTCLVYRNGGRKHR